jgi:hypothetical protein
LANDEQRSFRHGPPISRGKVVEHDDAFTDVNQFMDHLATDIDRRRRD